MSTLSPTQERRHQPATRDNTLASLLCRLGSHCTDVDVLDSLLELLLATCDAISFVHGGGDLHGGLSPDKVMLRERGRVSLRNGGPGAPSFMATEQAWGRRADLDERTDVYGMGGILYSLLTQVAPHQGGNASADLELARRGAVRTPQDIHPSRSLPPELCRIAMRALAMNPSDRHPSIALLKQDIERFIRKRDLPS